MKRLLVLLVATLAAWLGAGASAPAIAIPPCYKFAPAYDYAGGSISATLTNATTERAPPASHHLTSCPDAVACGSHGASARTDGPTPGEASTYDDLTVLARAASLTTTTGGHVGVPHGDLLSPARTDVAAKTEAGAAGKLANAACFVAGTQVLMANGTRKAIEDVKVADVVVSRNVATGKDEAHTVTRTFVHHDVAVYEVKVDGGKVTTTAEHPFMVKARGWTAVKNLKPGDQLVEPTGATVAVEAVTPTGRTTTVFNFEVENTHDYYVQVGDHWLLVHNMCDWPSRLLGTARSARSRFRS